MSDRFLLTPEERECVCSYCSKNMRRMRKEIGIRQEDLATALGTTQRHISEIENGKAAVSWTLMLAFSIFLVRFPQLWEIPKDSGADNEEENAVDSTVDNAPDSTEKGVGMLRIMMSSLKSGM